MYKLIPSWKLVTGLLSIIESLITQISTTQNVDALNRLEVPFFE